MSGNLLVFFYLTMSLLTVNVFAQSSPAPDFPEHPCTGQADFIDGKWKSDFRKGVYTCWCEGLLYPPNSTSSPCYDRLVKKRKAVCSTCNTLQADKPADQPIAPLGVEKIVESIERKDFTETTESTIESVKNPGESQKKTGVNGGGKALPFGQPLPLTAKERVKVLARIQSNPRLKQLSAQFQGNSDQYLSVTEAKKEARDLIKLLKDYPGLSIVIYGATQSTKRDEIMRSNQHTYRKGLEVAIFSQADMESKTEKEFKRIQSLASNRAAAGVRILLQLGLPKNRIRSHAGVNPGEALAVPIKDYKEESLMSAADASKNRRLIIEYYDIDGKVLNPIKR